MLYFCPSCLLFCNQSEHVGAYYNVKNVVDDDSDDGRGGGDNDKNDDDGDNDDICVMKMISCLNNAGKVILVTNLKFSSRALLPVCHSLLCLKKSTVEITLKSPKSYMLRARREETLPHTNKSIKTVELSQHNCDIRVHSAPSHEADHCGSRKQTFACGV